MYPPNWKERVFIERERLESEYPDCPQDELDKMAEEAAEDYIAGWADYMIDKRKDERMEERES